MVTSFTFSQSNTREELINKLQSNLKDTARVNTFNKLSKAYTLSNNDSSLFYATKALELAKELDYIEGEAAANERIAQANIYIGNYDEALINSIKALDLFVMFGDPTDEAEILRQIGSIHMYQGSFEQGMDVLKKALKIFQKEGDLQGEASTYNALGNIAQKKGDYPEASEYLYQALTLNREIGNISGAADALNNLGIIYEFQEEFEKALNNYEQSYKVYQELDDKIGVAIGLHNAGIILKKIGKYDSAIHNFNAAMLIDFEMGALDGVAYDKKELGETYLLMGRLDTAYKYLHEALALSQHIHDPVVTVPTLIGLGNIHKRHNNIDSALYFLNGAFNQAEKFELQNELKEASKSLYELYDELGNVKMAYQFHKTYHQLKDMLFNEDKIKKLAILEAEYEYDKRRGEQELKSKLSNMEKDRQIADAVWVRNTSVIGLLILALLAVFIYINYRRKRIAHENLNSLNEEVIRQKEELSEQAQELVELNNRLTSLNDTLELKVVKRTKQLENKNLQLEIKNQKLANYAFYNAHKLRAPLASLMGLTNLLTNPRIDLEERETITHKIQDCSNILNTVIQEMRELLEEE